MYLSLINTVWLVVQSVSPTGFNHISAAWTHVLKLHQRPSKFLSLSVSAVVKCKCKVRQPKRISYYCLVQLSAAIIRFGYPIILDKTVKLQRAACAPLNPAGCPIQFPQPAPSSVEKTNKPISLWEKAAHKQVSKSQQRLVSASDSPGVVQDLHYRNRPDRCDLFFSGLGSGSAPPVTFTPHLTPAGSDYLAALSGRQCLVM